MNKGWNSSPLSSSFFFSKMFNSASNACSINLILQILSPKKKGVQQYISLSFLCGTAHNAKLDRHWNHLAKRHESIGLSEYLHNLEIWPLCLKETFAIDDFYALKTYAKRVFVRTLLAFCWRCKTANKKRPLLSTFGRMHTEVQAN